MLDYDPEGKRSGKKKKLVLLKLEANANSKGRELVPIKDPSGLSSSIFLSFLRFNGQTQAGL